MYKYFVWLFVFEKIDRSLIWASCKLGVTINWYQLTNSMKWSHSWESSVTVLLATCFNAGFLLNLFCDPEDGGDMFPRKVGWHSTDYTALYPRRWYSSNFGITATIQIFRCFVPYLKCIKIYEITILPHLCRGVKLGLTIEMKDINLGYLRRKC
jgi:hypothetical protein